MWNGFRTLPLFVICHVWNSMHVLQSIFSEISQQITFLCGNLADHCKNSFKICYLFIVLNHWAIYLAHSGTFDSCIWIKKIIIRHYRALQLERVARINKENAVLKQARLAKDGDMFLLTQKNAQCMMLVMVSKIKSSPVNLLRLCMVFRSFLFCF